MTKSVLVSGASVAGPSAAYWLHRYGYSVTVVEAAPALRPGGQAVDFRGEQMRLVRAMGLLEELSEYETGMGDQLLLDPAGKPVLTIPSRFISGELELLRGDLARILHERTKDYTEYVFGDRVTTLTETSDGVEVSFRHGAPRRFDLVVGADGVHSGVRAAAFGPEERFRTDLGYYTAGFVAPNHLALDHRGLIHNEAGRGIMIASHRDPATVHVGLNFRGDPRGYGRPDLARQKEILSQAYAGAGWEVPRFLAAMADAPDLYFDRVGQIRVDRWSRGRVVLLGDAAWCAGPGGSGTGLAMMGAQVLAGELAAAGGDHRTAFARYEQRLRKPAHVGLKNGAGSGGFLVPPTERKVRSRNRTYRMLAGPLGGRLFDYMGTRAANAVKFREYAQPVVA
ncbi:FAD-dependent monooxygenase [Amycolatopsis jiangsuensis]|uniref:2-polyprenyl-6-methoxyphenol hydroxylase-like FAD-dependent oxidoreductase n=1 Tax=Amycolatopsis jiangsuensis TaxID=1181879 RepID=A0A840J6C5_9PSEU|nr:FAD-dependent monooxygenase [Amycolatopsis jiangsuensis]MBB4688957.1 2-polyprenyl-6-methoxyphenol hydroxylase-like FAD-dependent oxidoreductase [Amycolatopsis jiangsuensis]